MRRLTTLLAPVALVALLLGGWEAACRMLEVPAYLLPAPSAVALAIAGDAPALLHSAWNTLSMALLALVAASLFACSLALAVALGPTVERAVRPLAVVLQVTPVVAVAPLVVIWAGIDNPERLQKRLTAAINVSGQANRTDARAVQEQLLPPLLEAAQAITRLLRRKGS